MVSPFFPSQFGLSLLRRQVDRIVQRYPDIVTLPMDVRGRISQFRDWTKLSALVGESRSPLTRLWAAIRRPAPVRGEREDVVFERLSLEMRIKTLEVLCAFVESKRARSAAIPLRRAMRNVESAQDLLRRFPVGNAAREIRSQIIEAQKDLACAHLEILFSDPVFGQNIFKDYINGFDGYAEDKAGILRMIGERGFDGYIGFLISVMNQQWSQVWIVENFRVQKGLPLDDEEAEIHCASAKTILQLLSLIGESQLVRRHFRDGWIAKVSNGHDLEVVQSTVNAALLRVVDAQNGPERKVV